MSKNLPHPWPEGLAGAALLAVSLRSSIRRACPSQRSEALSREMTIV